MHTIPYVVLGSEVEYCRKLPIAIGLEFLYLILYKKLILEISKLRLSFGFIRLNFLH